jgi:hypothetical protein
VYNKLQDIKGVFMINVKILGVMTDYDSFLILADQELLSETCTDQQILFSPQECADAYQQAHIKKYGEHFVFF